MRSTRLYLFKINFETVLKSAIASYGGILAVFPTLRKFSVVFSVINVYPGASV